MRKLAAPAVLILSMALLGCPTTEDNNGKSGGSGGSASGGKGGSASGGSTGAGGSGSGGSGAGGSGTGGSASGGSSGTGGKAGSGGAKADSGAGGKPGSGGSGGAKPDSGGANDGPAAYFKSTCAYPVLSGFSPEEFCLAYTEICTYTGAGRWASEADCLAKFKGRASDSDACKAGHLCRAYKLPMLKKEMDCASAGTGSCNRND